jgi:hypothetical protein
VQAPRGRSFARVARLLDSLHVFPSLRPHGGTGSLPSSGQVIRHTAPEVARGLYMP